MFTVQSHPDVIGGRAQPQCCSSAVVSSRSNQSRFVCFLLLFFNLICVYGPLINSDGGNKYTVATGKVKGFVLGFEVSILAPSRLL